MKILTRAAIPALAAGCLVFAGALAAHADPNQGGSEACSAPTQIAPQLTATTCVEYDWENYGADNFYFATVKVANSGPGTAYVEADLLIGSTTVYGNGVNVAPGSTQTSYTNWVDNPPNQPKTGRGYISENGWWTYTYSPSM
jgi:hypothetical protein